MKKRLYRTQDDRKLAGICGGLAEYFNIDATIVRILMVILFIFSVGFPVLIAYIIAAFVIPNKEDVI
ncbi:PspC domain-containing protein [Bacillus solitudinis]|uniref:PspC domain-containing protein n=1 Tax=Bacillus solitudinis TaxID=2014074 RepID=UPI000C23C740|nr:PspC domain-containing protein [Bacillus solitudinis]